MSLVSTRRGISYPNPDRSDRPDIPLWIGNLIPKLEEDMIFKAGTNAARIAAAHQANGGLAWWETDTHLLYYDDGAAWWIIGPSTTLGTYATRPAYNAVPVGSRYFATDTLGTWLTDGTQWILISQGRPRISVATFLAAPFSTVPYDGQEVAVLVDATNGVNFSFKYNSGSASAYKWESVGALDMYSEVTADESTASAAYVDLTTAGPSVTVPMAGDYDLIINVQGYNSLNAGQTQIAALKVGAAATVDADGFLCAPVTVSPGMGATRTYRKTGLTSTTVLKVQYKTSGGTAHFMNRNMRLRPVRCSAA